MSKSYNILRGVSHLFLPEDGCKSVFFFFFCVSHWCALLEKLEPLSIQPRRLNFALSFSKPEHQRCSQLGREGNRWLLPPPAF